MIEFDFVTFLLLIYSILNNLGTNARIPSHSVVDTCCIELVKTWKAYAKSAINVPKLKLYLLIEHPLQKTTLTY